LILCSEIKCYESTIFRKINGEDATYLKSEQLIYIEYKLLRSFSRFAPSG
jgi:hypothetical protein